MPNTPKRIAVILFNLGGPDKQTAVRPFLFNLFNDPAIISAPAPIRFLLAKFISTKRAPIAREIYNFIGGGSPILKFTEKQAKALEKKLGKDHKVFIAMRYWHPRASAVAKEVKNYNPDEIILLPLYPQFSTTTSRSSLREWKNKATKNGLAAPTKTVCCYPHHPSFIKAHVELLKKQYEKALKKGKPRVLFSAHGLPQKIVDKGDPYQWQVEQSARAVVEELGIKNLDYTVCYQSKVGPLEWLKPSTENEILRAAEEKRPVVITPIAFVSEHSETLVELDIEYKKLASDCGLDYYYRVPALGDHPRFIEALAGLCDMVTHKDPGTYSNAATRLCPANFRQCMCK